MNLSNEEINTLVYGIIAKEEFNILYQYIRNIKYGNKLNDISCMLNKGEVTLVFVNSKRKRFGICK